MEDLARELKALQSWEELRAESGVVGAEKYREARSDRMLWDDATLSRHFEIEWNCEIRPATADGGEVWGPERSNAGGYGLWVAIRPNSCNRLIELSLPCSLPLRLGSSRKISV